MAELAGRDTDPWLHGLWRRLPNPDSVLRRLGREQDAFDQIAYDAHVIGELRAIRGGLLSRRSRVVEGGETRAARGAADLCREIMARPAAPAMGWPETIWTMAQAIFRGYAVHEVAWRRDGRRMVPDMVIDRPNRRFRFDARDNRLRLLTRRDPTFGVELPEKTMLLTRHMPSYDNPYGVAVYSACFWPYVFKHSGYRYFTKLAERFGLPWPVGKYAGDRGRAEQMLEELVKMLSAGAIAIPAEESVEFLESGAGGGSGGGSPQERLIDACNRELSKALTSQTLATEIQGTGSRAASEVHAGRQQTVQDSDRETISSTFDELFAWTTELNFPAGTPPPRHEFRREAGAAAIKEWAEVYDVARSYLPISRAEAHERLEISPPASAGDALEPAAAPAAEFAAPGGAPESEVERGLEALVAAAEAEAGASGAADLARPVVAAAREDPELLLGHLAELRPRLDSGALEDLLSRALFLAEAWGRLNGDGDG